VSIINQTASGSATAVETTGSTDPALHNPRQAVGSSQPAGATDPALSTPRPPFENVVTDGGGVGVVTDTASRLKSPPTQGPVATQHSQPTVRPIPIKRR
jgi:hypothetical protein